MAYGQNASSCDALNSILFRISVTESLYLTEARAQYNIVSVQQILLHTYLTNHSIQSKTHFGEILSAFLEVIQR